MKHYKSLLLMLSMTVFTLVLIGGCGSDEHDGSSEAEHNGQEMHDGYDGHGHDDDGHGHDADGHGHDDDGHGHDDDDAHMDADKDTGANTKASSADKVYQCPMKCEGEKTYKSNVGCPVCGMDLEEVKS